MAYGAHEIKEKIKALNFPSDSYVVLGSASLAVRGIRETRDLDLIVTKELFEDLSRSGWTHDPEFDRKWNRKRLTLGDAEVYSDLYFEGKKEFASAQI